MNLRMFLAAMLSLLLGSAIYLVVRPDPVWFVPLAFHQPLLLPHWLCDIAGSLPAAAHVIALSLATAALLHPRSGHLALAIACSWAFVNIAFELGQHPDLAPWLVTSLPDRLDDLWLLDQLRSYFAHGSFDFLDIVAALAGAVGARLLIAPLTEETLHAS